jgi:hypothetical protein
LYVNFDKCDFYQRKIQYLGRVISKDGIAVDPEKIRFITEWPIPKYAADIISFMGIIGYYRRFIKGFSIITYLDHITTKKWNKI